MKFKEIFNKLSELTKKNAVGQATCRSIGQKTVLPQHPQNIRNNKCPTRKLFLGIVIGLILIISKVLTNLSNKITPDVSSVNIGNINLSYSDFTQYIIYILCVAAVIIAAIVFICFYFTVKKRITEKYLGDIIYCIKFPAAIAMTVVQCVILAVVGEKVIPAFIFINEIPKVSDNYLNLIVFSILTLSGLFFTIILQYVSTVLTNKRIVHTSIFPFIKDREILLQDIHTIKKCEFGYEIKTQTGEVFPVILLGSKQIYIKILECRLDLLIRRQQADSNGLAI